MSTSKCKYLEYNAESIEDIDFSIGGLISPENNRWIIFSFILSLRLELILLGVGASDRNIIDTGLYELFEILYLSRLQLCVDEKTVKVCLFEIVSNIVQFSFGEKDFFGDMPDFEKRRVGQRFSNDLVSPFSIEIAFGLRLQLIEDYSIFLLTLRITCKIPLPRDVFI